MDDKRTRRWLSDVRNFRRRIGPRCLVVSHALVRAFNGASGPNTSVFRDRRVLNVIRERSVIHFSKGRLNATTAPREGEIPGMGMKHNWAKTTWITGIYFSSFRTSIRIAPWSLVNLLSILVASWSVCNSLTGASLRALLYSWRTEHHWFAQEIRGRPADARAIQTGCRFIKRQPLMFESAVTVFSTPSRRIRKEES